MKNYHPLYLGNIRMVKKNEKEKFFPFKFCLANDCILLFSFINTWIIYLNSCFY
jgi:hypothetical protein